MELYRPFTIQQRLEVIDAFRQNIASGRMEVYMLREKGLKLEKSVIVEYCTDHSIALIWNKNERERAALTLYEDSVVEAFLDFLESLREGELVVKRQDLLKYLEAIPGRYIRE